MKCCLGLSECRTGGGFGIVVMAAKWERKREREKEERVESENEMLYNRCILNYAWLHASIAAALMFDLVCTLETISSRCLLNFFFFCFSSNSIFLSSTLLTFDKLNVFHFFFFFLIYSLNFERFVPNSMKDEATS